MNDQPPPLNFSPLREHDFQSRAPLVGPLIQAVRRILYELTAKWGVVVVIHQQDQINQIVARYLSEHEKQLREHDQRLQEYDARLIDQDRDLAHLSRAIAELEIRQRHLARLVEPPSSADHDSPTSLPAE